MTEYPLVNIEEIAPGAITATEVKSCQGRFLFPPGQTLSVKDIQKCKAWGVWHLRVTENPGEPLQENGYDREGVKEIRDAILPFFAAWKFKQDPNKEIFKNIVLWTAQTGIDVPDSGKESNSPQTAPSPQPGDAKPDLENIIQKDENLATLPDIFNRLMAAVNDPKCTSHHLAEILGNDPALCAKLLKLVNSPVYGLMRKIESMERAVTLVGINEISKIALSISVISMFRDIPEEIMDMRKFWSHCIGCGLVAEIISEEMHISSERLLVAGMLHDIGRLIMLKNHPRTTLYAMHKARSKRLPLHAVEKDIWGFDHCEVGQRILELWSLPDFLVQTARYHHGYEKSDYKQEIGIIQLADCLVQAMFMGYSGNSFIPGVPACLWDEPGISPRSIAGIFTQAQYRAEEMIGTLL